METVADFIFLDSKITVDGNCTHEIKRCLPLAPQKKSNDKPRQCNKKQRHYFAEGPSSQSYGFPVVMYGCESWTVKKAEHQELTLSN